MSIGASYLTLYILEEITAEHEDIQTASFGYIPAAKKKTKVSVACRTDGCVMPDQARLLIENT